MTKSIRNWSAEGIWFHRGVCLKVIQEVTVTPDHQFRPRLFRKRKPQFSTVNPPCSLTTMPATFSNCCFPGEICRAELLAPRSHPQHYNNAYVLLLFTGPARENPEGYHERRWRYQTGTVRNRRAAGQRRHGRGIPRPRHETRAGSSDQDPA